LLAEHQSPTRRHRRDKLFQDPSRQLDVVLSQLQRASSVHVVKPFSHESSEVGIHRTASRQSGVRAGRCTDGGVMSGRQRRHRAVRQTCALTRRRLVACCVPASSSHNSNIYRAAFTVMHHAQTAGKPGV